MRKWHVVFGNMRHEFIYRGYGRTIAAFASAQVEREEMRFEWGKRIQRARANALLFLDEERAWWHYCIEDVVQLLEKHRPEKLVGSSMGGYGALLFGGMLGITTLAFCPQTALAVSWDQRYERWLSQVREQTQHPELLTLNYTGRRLEIVYCEHNKMDRRHAERMDVRLKPLDCSSHQPALEIENIWVLL